MASRGPWQVAPKAAYCIVFEFRGELIKRVHIYVNPDFTSTQRALPLGR